MQLGPWQYSRRRVTCAGGRRACEAAQRPDTDAPASQAHLAERAWPSGRGRSQKRHTGFGGGPPRQKSGPHPAGALFSPTHRQPQVGGKGLALAWGNLTRLSYRVRYRSCRAVSDSTSNWWPGLAIPAEFGRVLLLRAGVLRSPPSPPIRMPAWPEQISRSRLERNALRGLELERLLAAVQPAANSNAAAQRSHIVPGSRARPDGVLSSAGRAQSLPGCDPDARCPRWAPRWRPGTPSRRVTRRRPACACPPGAPSGALPAWQALVPAPRLQLLACRLSTVRLRRSILDDYAKTNANQQMAKDSARPRLQRPSLLEGVKEAVQGVLRPESAGPGAPDNAARVRPSAAAPEQPAGLLERPGSRSGRPACGGPAGCKSEPKAGQ